MDSKRGTFFLLGLIWALSFIFVGLQYSSVPSDEGDLEDFENLTQDLDFSVPDDQKDMVSAEAPASKPVSKSITQEVKAVDKTEDAPQKINTTTSDLVIGDGQGAVDGANVKEAAPETAVDTSNPNALTEAPIHFTVVQKIPEFPGGWSAFMQWLTKNLKYPAAAQQNKVEGMVVVSFVVNKDGSVADIKLSQTANPLLDREALRVMKMMPKWKPGMDNDKVCRTMIAVPVVFKL